MMVTEQEQAPPSSLGLVLLCDGMYGRARKHAFVLMKYGGVFDSVDDKEGLSLTSHMNLLCRRFNRKATVCACAMSMSSDLMMVPSHEWKTTARAGNGDKERLCETSVTTVNHQCLGC